MLCVSVCFFVFFLGGGWWHWDRGGRSSDRQWVNSTTMWPTPPSKKVTLWYGTAGAVSSACVKLICGSSRHVSFHCLDTIAWGWQPHLILPDRQHVNSTIWPRHPGLTPWVRWRNKLEWFAGRTDVSVFSVWTGCVVCRCNYYPIRHNEKKKYLSASTTHDNICL